MLANAALELQQSAAKALGKVQSEIRSSFLVWARRGGCRHLVGVETSTPRTSESGPLAQCTLGNSLPTALGSDCGEGRVLPQGLCTPFASQPRAQHSRDHQG